MANKKKGLTVLFGLLVVFSPQTVAGGTGPAVSQPIRFAVIQGEGRRALPPVTLGLVEGAMLSQPGVQFVEREDIIRILAEQKLGLANLTQPATAAKAGKLLSADVLLFLERTEVNGEALVRLAFVETRTGVMLLSRIIPEVDILNETASLPDAVGTALRKARISPGERHYVAVLSLQSGEPGHYLDGLADGVRLVLEDDLSRAPDVILLDRDHLDYLRREGQLTELDLQVKAATTLLEGRVQRDQTGEIVQTFRLMSVEEQNQGEVSVATPTGTPLLKHRDLAAHIIEKLGGAVPEDTWVDPAAESLQYAQQAVYSLSHHDDSAATQAAEAAFALGPSLAHEALLIQSWMQRADRITPSRPFCHQLAYSRNHAGVYQNLTYEQKKDLLRSALRVADVTSGCLTRLSGGVDVKKNSKGILGQLSKNIIFANHALIFPITENETDLAQLRDELRGAQIANSRLCLQVAQAAGRDDLTVEALINSMQMSPFWSKDIPGFVSLVREIVMAWEDFQGRAGDYLAANSLTPMFFDRILDAGKYMERRFTSPDDQRALASLSTWLIERKLPAVVLIGYLWRCDTQSTRQIPGIFFGQRIMSNSHHAFAWPLSLEQCGALYIPEEFDSFCRPLLDTVLAAQDAEVVGAWSTILTRCLRPGEALCQGDTRDKPCPMFDYADGFLKILYTAKNSQGIVHYDEIVKILENLKDKYARPGQVAPSLWDAVTLEQISVKEGGPVLRAMAVGNEVYLVRKNVPKRGGAAVLAVTMTRLDTVNGHETFLGDYDIPVSDQVTGESVTGMAVQGDNVALGTLASGMLLCRYQKCTLYTEKDGLASNYIGSLEWYDDQLYIGFGHYDHVSKYNALGGGGLGVFHPGDGTFQLLFASESSVKNYPLDKTESYSVVNILADRQRACLWIGVTYSESKPGPLNALWQFFPKDNRLVQVWSPDGRIFTFDRKMVWQDGGLFMSTSFAEAVLLDVDELKATWLVGPPWVAVYGYRIFRPHALLGEYLMNGDGTLKLFKKDGDAPAVLIKTPRGERINTVDDLLMMADGSVIAIINGQKFWRIKKPQDPVSADAAGPEIRLRQQGLVK